MNKENTNPLSDPRNKKVLCPMEGKNGKTFWLRVGNAYVNRDGSTNVWLHAYPANGKLHIRDIDERDRTSNDQQSPSSMKSSAA